MHPEFVGILLNNNTYRRISSGRIGTESLANYEEAAAMYGLVPCFFTIHHISLDTGMVTGYIPIPSGYRRVHIPIPRAIHMRAIYHNRRELKRIEDLIKQGIFVFNGRTRYGKDTIHHMLEQDSGLSNALPHTVKATPISIRSMLSQHGDLVLKPCSGSIGIGIMRLKRSTGHSQLTYSRSSPSAKGWRTVTLAEGKLHPLIYQRIKRAPFLAQERIPLAEYRGRPFDIRVTVQRGSSGSWEIAGMFAKTSPPQTFVSNIAQGGSAYQVPDILTRCMPNAPVGETLERIAEFSLHIARILSLFIPYAADFGLDIGITEDGRLYFIECNGCDQRYGFLEAGMGEAWKNSYRNPMAFARYLYDNDAWPPH
ncbi:YheC/YheD family endospore coat-associated protein [Paenibacillus lautus]|uniref:YheC/YheD family endospore coat-associated protein n=1 Tax=Paenibacillus lautus TaxID=1401 RepID=UPI000FD9804E|nr:YheC/YheD family protein [Paenibacillus lautus]